MRIRPKSKTSIQYTLIASGSPIISTFTPPEAFKNDVIRFIKRCPLDLIQINNSLNFYELTKRTIWNDGYNLNVVNIQDFEELSDFIQSSEHIQLFFLDGEKNSHIKLFNKLIALKNDLHYFYFYKKEYKSINNKVVETPQEFISSIIFNQDSILKRLNIPNLKLNPSVTVEYKDYNEFYYFIPTRGNYNIINNLIGNFGGKKSQEYDDEIIKKHSEESTKANKNKYSFERQQSYISQIEKIDFFNILCYKENLIKQASGVEPILSPLILILPFHNPDLRKLYQNTAIIDLFQVEQTQNYINLIQKKDDVSIKMQMAGMEIQRERIAYLDDVAFLHSSFSFSPIIRFPMKGKSIYRELSFFKTDFFPNISVAKNRRKLKKTIYNFGKALKTQILSKEIEKVLKNRNGQIVCISDLPIEWLLLDGIPLSFTHDICRLPETSLHGLMSFYTSNTTLTYSIPENVLEKTLVIMGTDENGFKFWQDQVYELSKTKKFIIRECKTLEEVKKCIKEIKPDILIFDCHGGYDKSTRTTYLCIGNEILDGKFVIENEIFAPIIFLSACGTAPTYGTINSISNAFFEAGAISVTSTYLPISITSGSILYLRLLNKLDYASKNVIHKNWLEFVSHLIRTSSINDAYLLAMGKKEKINEIEWVSSNTKSLTDSLVFYKRRKLFNEMNKTISQLTDDKRNYFTETIPEYLLYSNLGRGDLILFDNWIEKHKEKNVC
ncbi:CHAT domain-containing protein [Polaribacter sp. AHE13PA]|jgi:hypothetical protein|uniref:CHAT domain-containing protein n=1 Tax=Polaribacter sp. AHE13PA TaxID=2745562 RepID=UPI001C4E612B|nr:CHAT domain-containing protein [Polaribacter sp. AHE13PA]QXP65764.1 hypothetical protein H0I28_11215 [Polaribacter sp. AHE13PA]